MQACREERGEADAGLVCSVEAEAPEGSKRSRKSRLKCDVCQEVCWSKDLP